MATQKSNVVNQTVITEAIKTLNGELFTQIDAAYKKNTAELVTTVMTELIKQQGEIESLKLMVKDLQASLNTVKASKPKAQPQVNTTGDMVVVAPVKKVAKVPAQPGSYFKFRYNTEPEYKEQIDTRFSSEIEKIRSSLTNSEKEKKDIVLTKLWAMIGKIYPDVKDEVVKSHAIARRGGSSEQQVQADEPDMNADNVNDIDD